MKHFTILLLLSLNAMTGLCGPALETLLKQGKSEFKLAKYPEATRKFELAVKLYPENAEAHYFLGYCYSRINSSDANGIPNSSLKLTIKSSQEFEKVNQLTPKYTGELVILDPYSKITAEWGSIAFKYLFHHKKDSAIWALKQGKMRGGFSDFFISFNRMNMKHCSKDAFMFISGDNYTFYCLYLQLVEQYRTDIKAIDPGMFESNWYANMIRDNFNIQFDMNKSSIDSCSYLKWNDSLIHINNFSWTLKPSYVNQYILRKDILLLSVLKQNKFKDEINFIVGYPDEDKISLETVCQQHLCLERVSTFPVESNWDSLLQGFSDYLYLSDRINTNSLMEVLNFESIQVKVLSFIYSTHLNGDDKNARKLMSMFNRHRKHYGPSFSDENMLNYYTNINLLFTKK
jgi:hypothetical protein